MNGGGSPPPADGRIVATTPYRDTSGGGRDMVPAYLFTVDAALEPGKTVRSITLPSDVSNGQLHVFAFAIGTPA